MKGKQKILVTGASSGIGKAIFEHLQTIGQDVIGTSRNQQLVDRKDDFILLDVTDDKSVAACVSQFLDRFGKIDVLINNAGYGLAGAIEDTSIDEAQQQFDTNFFGAVRMVKAVLPSMRQQRSGLIINISSLGGMIGMPFQAFYAASKFALQGFVEALRVEIAPFNIRATNIVPGDFNTSFTANRLQNQTTLTAYEPYLENAMKVYIKDEENGLDPLHIACRVEKIIHAGNRNPKVNYISASFIQRLFLVLKQVVDSRIFERGFKLIYGQYIKNKH